MNIVPLDIEALSVMEMEAFFKAPFWPCGPDIYDSIATQNMDFLFGLYDSLFGTERTLIQLVFRQLYMDFNFFACDFLDVFFTKKAERKPVCGKNSVLYKGTIEESLSNIPPSMALDRKSFTEKLKDVLRPIIKKRFVMESINQAGTPLYFTNGLTKMFSTYCCENSLPVPCTIPNYFFSRAPSFSFRLSGAEKLSETVADGWAKIISSTTGTQLPENYRSYVKGIAGYYISWGLRDIVKKCPFPLKDSVFFSGTGGGYWNRLISLKVQSVGGTVIRMDHGGERPFFADKWWGINELAFCDKFVTFSTAGALQIKKNLEKVYRTLLDSPEKLEVETIKEKNFSALTEKSTRFPLKNEVPKSVMLVPAGFMGEFNAVPSFTVPDVPYAAFQVKILEALKNAGLEVYYKQAPKAARDCLFGPEKYGAKIVRGFLSECLDMPDSFLFTFCGTAFCEALCTEKIIILIKAPPFRPMLPELEKELDAACRVVRGSLGKDNIQTVNMEELLNALKKPMSTSELEERRIFREKWLLL
ncbi:MAG: hypothetical protein A2020_06240 [Lentisphaerae bacterium GWF2_45_14]|nr:MAG: hypothetical protein A2020_06240 [Lentisphaerae bacterium GWF2_45_14]